MVSSEAALLELLQRLKQADYRFTAVTPATHARVLAKPMQGAADLRDVFGWNRLFDERGLPVDIVEIAERAGVLEATEAGLRSRIRVATLGEDLFLHSAFPTDSADAVFFGPDTYRFARFLQANVPQLSPTPRSIVDMGAGSGAGGIFAARLLPTAELTLVDVNAAALQLASVNAAAARVEAQLVEADRVPTGDLVIANPPYMIDPARRSYRDGGDLHGGAVALDWAKQALASGSTMLLYTGAAIVRGASPLIEALHEACSSAGASLDVEEIDPDVFGDELEQPAYAEVERIAVIGAVIGKSA